MDVDLHVGELERDALEPVDPLPEGLTGGRVADREVERRLDQSHTEGRDLDPSEVQRGEELLKAALGVTQHR